MEVGTNSPIKAHDVPVSRHEETGTCPSTLRVKHAFNKGDLYVRNLISTPKNGDEISFLNQRKIFGVCATHMMRGGRTTCFNRDEPVLVISDPRPLFFYKEVAGTTDIRDALTQGRKIEHSIPPLCGKYSHMQKMREICQRSCSHYPEWTSGHLNEYTTFSPRKPKNTDGYYGKKADYNEIVLESYQTRNIAGIGGVDSQVIGDRFTCNWIKILELHQKITSGVQGCSSLPLVFFQSVPTSITAILSLEQEGYSAEQVIQQLELVMDFAAANGQNINKLGKLLAMLPAKTVLGRIMALNLPETSPSQHLAVELATKLNLDGKSYWFSPHYHFPYLQQFQEIIHAGASFQKVISNREGHPRSLVYYSLFDGTLGNFNTFDIVHERKERLTPEQFLGKAREIENRIDEMISAGLIRPELLSLDFNDFPKNPFAYIYLLKKGCRSEYFAINFFLKIKEIFSQLPVRNQSNYIIDALRIIKSKHGWGTINDNCTFCLTGCHCSFNDNPGALILQLQEDWLYQNANLINTVQTAFFLLKNGATCRISPSFKNDLLTAFQKEPARFQLVYQHNAEQLIEYIDKMNAQNILLQEGDIPEEDKPALELKSDIDLLIQLFARGKPEINSESLLSEKIQTVLDTYYSAPGPATARNLLNTRSALPNRVRGLHDCDHAVRTALFSRIFMQFLQSCDQTSSDYLCKEPALLDLLTLAELYHDAVAEDEDKSQEEIQAALYLMRDLKGQYPDGLLLNVAVALANKNMRDCQCMEQERKKILEQVPEHLIAQIAPELWAQFKPRFFKPPAETTPDAHFQEWLLGVIRFGDTVDFARCSGEKDFNWDYLPLPSNISRADRCRIGEIVKACWNLSALTGGAPIDNNYHQLHGLRRPDSSPAVLQNRSIRNHNQLIRKTISSHDNVWQAVRTELDRMARRAIAEKAGIRPAQQGDIMASTQPNYPLIFDEQDLDQVPLPAELSELETLWISTGSFHNLSAERKIQVKHCIKQLKSTQIQHPLGTLSQETIAKAKTELRKRNLEARDDNFNFNGHPLTVQRLRMTDTAQPTPQQMRRSCLTL